MTIILELSTKTSLYPDIEIKIEHPPGQEKTYKARRITEALRISMKPLISEISKQKSGAIAKWVKMVFGVDAKILAQLPFREVEDIYLGTAKHLRELDAKRLETSTSDLKEAAKAVEDIEQDAEIIGAGEIEKNVNGPGEKE